MHTVEQLSKMFNVSTKTISRWRGRGWSAAGSCSTAPKRVGFLNSSVERFVSSNHGADSARRAVQPADARRSAARSSTVPGGWPGRGRPAEVDAAHRQAHESQRRDDSLHAQAVRPEATRTGDLSRPHRAVDRGDRRRGSTSSTAAGQSVDELAKRFGRTRTSIYRVINEMRAQRILELPLDYMYNEEFDCGRTPNRRSSAPLPEATAAPKKAARARRDCRPTWRRCTKCRC